MQFSDNELVAQCLTGSDAAFRELVERYQNRIYSLAYRMMGNRADAEDLAQEAFIRAYTALPRFKPTDFGPWLYRIATNLCINALRSGRRTVAVDPVDLDLHVGSDSSESTEQMHAVQTAIQSLDEDYRAVVVLRFTEGLSYEEIAEVLDVSLSTVTMRLHRAKKRLRELLKEWV